MSYDNVLLIAFLIYNIVSFRFICEYYNVSINLSVVPFNFSFSCFVLAIFLKRYHGERHTAATIPGIG